MGLSDWSGPLRHMGATDGVGAVASAASSNSRRALSERTPGGPVRRGRRGPKMARPYRSVIHRYAQLVCNQIGSERMQLARSQRRYLLWPLALEMFPVAAVAALRALC